MTFTYPEEVQDLIRDAAEIVRENPLDEDEAQRIEGEALAARLKDWAEGADWAQIAHDALAEVI